MGYDQQEYDGTTISMASVHMNVSKGIGSDIGDDGTDGINLRSIKVRTTGQAPKATD